MGEESSDLESRVEDLARRLGAVERRLAALESPAAPPPRTEPVEVVEPRPEQPAAGRWFSTEALPRYGRTLVVLGGAFLLRAVTEGGLVPQVAGTALGIAYAMFWFAIADRSAARGRVRSATFHGIAACVIVFPLLWEATVQFELLPPMASAAALAVVTALALVVVVRRRLPGLVVAVTLGSALTALALAFSTRLWSLFVFELLLLALATMWLGYERGWRPLAWTVCAMVNATVLLMTAVVIFAVEERVWELFSPNMLLAIQLSWVVLFFGTVGYRKLAYREDLTPGEFLLGLVALVVGLGGASVVTRSVWVPGTSLGVVSLVLAAGLYGMAFAFADRTQGHRLSFVAYSTFALLATFVASGALLRGAALTVTLCLAAVVTAWLGARKARATLSLHSAVYILAAAAASGSLASGFEAFAAASVPSPAWITPYVLLVFVAACVFFGLPVVEHGRTWGRFSSAPMLAIIAVLCFGVGAVAVTLGGRLVPAGADAAADPGILAALRTGVLAAIAVALAGLSRTTRWSHAFWLVYPTLGLGALKLLLDDVRRGRPATLFVSFALYGAALILAPRLARQRQGRRS